jgi:hypothetical protein
LEHRCLPSAATINISRLAGNQNSPTLAVNPAKPGQEAAFANDEATFGNGIFAAYSTDAGKTWTGRDIATGSDSLPVATGDPQCAFDNLGNLFVTYVDTAGQVAILLSADGGVTFTTAGTIGSGFTSQPSIATGGGSVWVSFESLGEIFASGARIDSLGKVENFTGLTAIPNSFNGNYGDVAVSGTGQVIVTFQTGSTPGPSTIYTSFDNLGIGGTFLPAQLAKSTNVGGANNNVPAQTNFRGIDAEANLGYDNSGGLFNGRIYLVYTDATQPGGSSTNIFLTYSTDHGNTWSSSVQVTDDTGSNSKFLPTIAVDQSTGNIAVSWYDARLDNGQGGPNDPNKIPNDDVQLWGTFSSDGGVSFNPNTQISTGTSNSGDSGAFLGYGDYLQAKGAFVGGIYNPVWADNSNSTLDNPDGTLKALDIYTTQIPFTAVLVAPTVTSVSMSPSPGVEGASVTLTGNVTNDDVKNNATVNVNWGDGSIDTFTILGTDTVFTHTHTYIEETAPGSSYTVSASVANSVGTSNTQTTTESVSDAALLVTSGGSLTVPKATSTPIDLGSFSDNDPNGIVADYTATVTSFGDGTSGSPATVQPNTSGGFDVFATHNYTEGVYQVTIVVNDVGGATTTINEVVNVVAGGEFATGADAGGGPQVNVYDGGSSALKFSFYAYAPTFTGGVRVALGDVNGDGVPDIITAPGPGMAPEIHVYDGVTGKLIQDFMAYDPGFTGGVYVAVADVNHDGFADIITGAGASGGPHVKVFDGKSLTNGTLSTLYSFMAYDPRFLGGVSVAAGDVNHDGFADIITAPGAGGGPDVRVFSGADGSKIQEFMAYDPRFMGGVYVATGDVNGDGYSDIITGAGFGGGPEVKVFSGKDNSILQDFMAYKASVFSGGVRVGAFDTAPGVPADIVTEGGPGTQQFLQALNGESLKTLDSFYAYDPAFSGGVFVGGV